MYNKKKILESMCTISIHVILYLMITLLVFYNHVLSNMFELFYKYHIKYIPYRPKMKRTASILKIALMPSPYFIHTKSSRLNFILKIGLVNIMQSVMSSVYLCIVLSVFMYFFLFYCVVYFYVFKHFRHERSVHVRFRTAHSVFYSTKKKETVN